MCKVEWCDNKPCVSGRGYCRYHYDQVRKYGNTTNDRPNGNRNNYINKGDYSLLQILDGSGEVIIEVKVDTEDIDKLKKYSFRYEKDRYIKTVRRNKTYYLHRIVLDYNGDLEIDHINRNKLDNRKDNLRIVTRKENANNRERKESYGIVNTKRSLTKPFALNVFKNNKKIWLGYYSTYEEARKVRDAYLNKGLKGGI